MHLTAQVQRSPYSTPDMDRGRTTQSDPAVPFTATTTLVERLSCATQKELDVRALALRLDCTRTLVQPALGLPLVLWEVEFRATAIWSSTRRQTQLSTTTLEEEADLRESPQEDILHSQGNRLSHTGNLHKDTRDNRRAKDMLDNKARVDKDIHRATLHMAGNDDG